MNSTEDDDAGACSLPPVWCPLPCVRTEQNTFMLHANGGVAERNDASPEPVFDVVDEVRKFDAEDYAGLRAAFAKRDAAYAKERADREASEAYLLAHDWRQNAPDEWSHPFRRGDLDSVRASTLTLAEAVEVQVKADAAALAFVLARVSFVAKWKDGSETVVDLVGTTIEAKVNL